MVNDSSPSDYLTINSTPRQSDNSTSSNSEYNGSSKSGKTDRVRKNGRSQWREDDTPKVSQQSFLQSSPSNGASNKDEEAMKKLFSDYKVFENWCSITYYEFNTQVGETFHVTNNSLAINVNNYNDLSNDTRFCLGSLTNESRNKISEQIKKNIGTGIVMYLQTNGDVWLRQDCGEDVFVESNFLTKENRLINNTAAQQICTHAYNKIFSLRSVYEQMKQRLNSDLSSTVDINNFKEFFTLYIGFSEVWGPKCLRKTIDELPCWLEIHLHPASKLLDILLSQ